MLMVIIQKGKNDDVGGKIQYLSNMKGYRKTEGVISICIFLLWRRGEVYNHLIKHRLGFGEVRNLPDRSQGRADLFQIPLKDDLTWCESRQTHGTKKFFQRQSLNGNYFFLFLVGPHSSSQDLICMPKKSCLFSKVRFHTVFI